MKSKAIITLAIGDTFTKMAESTHPLMRKYAEKCSADFIVIDKPQLQNSLGLVTYEKFQVYDYLDGRYDQVLFIDTDIVVCPNAPNVFDICKKGTFGASNEEGYSMSEFHKEATQRQLGNISWNAPYFNSGVMLFDPSHKAVFDPQGTLLQRWISCDENSDHIMSDQPILNYLVNQGGYAFLDFGYKFNRTRVLKDTHNRFNSYFIHYAGPSGHRYGERLDQISADAKIAKSPFKFWLSKNFPIFRWILDRLSPAFAQYIFNRLHPKKQ